MTTNFGDYDFVIVANRLPVDRVTDPDGSTSWRRSPGGLVTALEPVMQKADGAWVGWSGTPDSFDPFDADGMRLVAVGLSEEEVRHYYEGFSNGTLWPLYHDVIVSPEFHRTWWDAYVKVNRRFAAAAAEQAAEGAIVWVQDYQLQLVPGLLREQRPDLRIGFFNHIPFPGYEIYAQLPWRRQIVEGLLGADLIGFQRQSDATNFLRACRRAAGLTTKGSTVRMSMTGWSASGRSRSRSTPPASRRSPGDRRCASAPPRSGSRSATPTCSCSASIASTTPRESRTGSRPTASCCDDGRLTSPQAKLVLVASPSRERVEQYRLLRDEVEVTVGRINGEFGEVGTAPVHYLHQSYPPEEMAALFLAADVMLVTSLRDGMNLVAKEYVACRYDETGALVLSEFTGAADELTSAFLINPHDIDGMKDAIVAAANVSPAESTAADAVTAPAGQGVRHPALGRRFPDRARPGYRQPPGTDRSD